MILNTKFLSVLYHNDNLFFFFQEKCVFPDPKPNKKQIDQKHCKLFGHRNEFVARVQFWTPHS